VILIDTNALIDVVTRDPIWFEWSRDELARASISDEVVAINEVVYAELSVRYPSEALLDATLERMGLALEPTPRAALFLAARSFQRYRTAGGSRTGVLPDFFIGAQAIVMNAPLITRDARRYRTYFPSIELITPDLN
jgi:predicted nucleic acid-binding protein